jgi:hypothetical protein
MAARSTHTGARRADVPRWSAENEHSRHHQ